MNQESPWKGRLNAVAGVVILMAIAYGIDRAFNLVRSLNPAHPCHLDANGRWHYRYSPTQVLNRLWLGALPWGIFLSLLTYHAICFHMCDSTLGKNLGNRYEYGFPWLVFLAVFPFFTAGLGLRLYWQWSKFKSTEHLRNPVLYRQWALEQFRTYYRSGRNPTHNQIVAITGRMQDADVKWMTGQFQTFA